MTSKTFVFHCDMFNLFHFLEERFKFADLFLCKSIRLRNVKDKNGVFLNFFGVRPTTKSTIVFQVCLGYRVSRRRVGSGEGFEVAGSS